MFFSSIPLGSASPPSSLGTYQGTLIRPGKRGIFIAVGQIDLQLFQAIHTWNNPQHAIRHKNLCNRKKRQQDAT
jgi:hypothetical protein